MSLTAPSDLSTVRDPEPDKRSGRPWWKRPRAVLVALFAGSSFLFWLYAFSGLAKERPPDKFHDAAFATAAGPICQSAKDRLAQLPLANTARTPAERADTVEVANAELAAMVADLRKIPTTNPTDAKLAASWLADWDSLLQSRQQYALDVRSNPRAKFYVQERKAQAITEPMDNLALVNHIAACETPDDVG